MLTKATLTKGSLDQWEVKAIFMHQDNWAFISDHINHGKPKATFRRMALSTFLVSAGFSYLHVTGTYMGMPEDSYMVLGISSTEAALIGRMFSQVHVLTGSRGLVGCTGDGVGRDRPIKVKHLTQEHPSKHGHRDYSVISCEDGSKVNIAVELW